MRISDWSSDVCSSDLKGLEGRERRQALAHARHIRPIFAAGKPCRGGRGHGAAVTSQAFRVDAVAEAGRRQGDRKSVVSGKSGSVRVDLGGRRILKIKTYTLVIKIHISNINKIH